MNVGRILQWRTEGEEMLATADIFLSSMKRSMKPEHGKVPDVEEIEKKCYNHLNDTFDEQYKGFAPAPKFPKCGKCIIFQRNSFIQT